jgi:hypothetical protein
MTYPHFTLTYPHYTLTNPHFTLTNLYLTAIYLHFISYIFFIYLLYMSYVYHFLEKPVTRSPFLYCIYKVSLLKSTFPPPVLS